VAKAKKKASPFLEMVARHERDLLAQVALVEEEGRRIVAAAESDARARLVEAEEKLKEEIAALLAQAESAGQAERRAVIADRESAVAALRDKVQEKIPALVQEIVFSIVPVRDEGTRS